jgi:hypothetical protein
MDCLPRKLTKTLVSNRHQAGVKNMSTVIAVATRAWVRMFEYITARNERAVAAWGSSLQYKRRYTNPDDAIAARKYRR